MSRRSSRIGRALDPLLVALLRASAWLRALRWRLSPRGLDERLARELSHHRALLAESESGGRLGDPRALRSECHVAYGLQPPAPRGAERMTPTPRELRAIVRGLFRSPLFTVSSVAILALGTAATISLFGVVHAVFLEPLPYPHADRLVRVWSINGENRSANHNPLDLFDYSRAAGVENVAALTTTSVTWQSEGSSQRVQGTVASVGWLDVLGVEPLLGRDFSSDESLPGQDAVVLLGHAFWRDRLGADPDVVGRRLVLDGLAHTVVGVLPAGFVHPLASDATDMVWPLTVDPDNTSRGGHYVQAIARLAPGATLRGAEAEIQTIARRLEDQHPTTNRDRSARLVPLRDGVVGDVEALLTILSLGVAILLLITAANVGALFLTRTLDRRGELSLRRALGASRARILVALALEGLAVALLGTLGGVALAWALRDATAALGLTRLPWGHTLEIGPSTLGFSVALALLTASILTLPAILRLSGEKGGGGLDERRGVSGDRRAASHRRLLVTGQVALALVLLVTAGLLTKSLDRLLSVDAGFDRAAVATARISLPGDRYDPPQRLAYFESLRERTLAGGGDPGDDVEAFGLVNRLPLSDSYSCDSFVAGGRPLPEPGAEDCAEDRVVDWGYFDAMGIHLLEGRVLSPEDREGRAPVVVVNETLARRYWPDRSAVGERLRWGGPESDTPWQEIVGVVADVRHFGLDREVRPEIYTNQRQNLWNASFWVAMRTSHPEAAIARLRDAAAELDPAVPLFDVRTMEERVLGSVESERLRSLLLRLFAGAAVLLTAVGLWGLIAYATAQARRELGVRLALGADRARILRWVLAQGLRPILIGAGLGLVAAWVAGRTLAGQLFGVSATDAPTLIGAVLVLVAVGLAATLAPAIRALGIDPMTALRED